MDEVRGIIVKKEEQKGEKNGKAWTRYNFTIRDEQGNDHKCSTFFAPMADNLPEENKVALEVEGQYNNIKNIIENDYDEKAASMVKDEAPKITTPIKFTPQDYNDKQKYWEDKEERATKRDQERQKLIVRQNALTNANKLIENLGALGVSEEDKKKLFLTGDPVEVVKNFAKKLEQWVFQE